MLNSNLCEILKFIQSHSDGIYMDEYYPDMPSSFQQIRVEYLCENGLVERFSVSNSQGLRILPKGEIELELYHSNAKAIHKSTRRYWITTLIAIVALLKSFIPELSGLWEAVSPLLMQLWKAITAALGT